VSAESRRGLRATLLTIAVCLAISFAVGFLVIAAYSAKGQTIELQVTPTPSPTTFIATYGKYPAASLRFSNDATIASTLTVPCGEKGAVVISMETGKVQFRDGCNPDEGARTFWTAIERMYQPCHNK
jgi:hypothetical protein